LESRWFYRAGMTASLLFGPQPTPAPARPAFTAASRLCWLITGLLAAVTAALVAARQVPVQIGQVPINAVVVVVFGPVAILYGSLRYDARVAVVCDSVALLSAYTLVAAISTYLATVIGAGVPLWDGRFLSADRALGFDWRDYLAWLDAHPHLGALLDASYRSALWQVAAVILVLGGFGHVRRLQGFVLALQLSLLVCIVAPAVTPALGAYAALHIDPVRDHPHIPLTLMNGAVPQILQLRGASPLIRVEDIQGIVVFPSFHTVLALLFAWAFWPVRVLRPVALLLNACMLAATPLSGGHYLVDLGAGVALGVGSLVVAIRGVDRCHHLVMRDAPARVSLTVPGAV
jgi:hypothetical protein